MFTFFATMHLKKWKIDIVNCSQMRFSNYISRVGLYVIFCLTDFSSHPFDFLSSKAG